MSEDYSDVVKQAKEYYDSYDADEFYYRVWGGEDFHLGIYEHEDEPIFDASRRTVQTIADQVTLNENTRVVDIGAGYGGAARFIASQYGCKVSCLNLSERENERNRQKNREQNLDHLIEVIDGSFESLPYEDASFDVVWSEDAILHSGDKESVVKEVARILKKGGSFVFTDPMQADDCPEGVIDPILERINLDSMGSVKLYRELAAKNGLKEVNVIDLAKYLPMHYDRVRRELESRYDEIIGIISKEYVDNMIRGLVRWVEGGRNGYLNWALMHFRKE
ncbi:MAG: methyltransferase domain-containing protein [Thermodesulfobacteriota bacterium]|nr:methyltransferase domain-containing protein [Thermodesulfobacteriota bacterium]